LKAAKGKARDMEKPMNVESPAAFRVLAFKWIRIIFHCWKELFADSEKKQIESLSRRGSRLIGRLDASGPAVSSR
jgi:hypothetical protein